MRRLFFVLLFLSFSGNLSGAQEIIIGTDEKYESNENEFDIKNCLKIARAQKVDVLLTYNVNAVKKRSGKGSPYIGGVIVKVFIKAISPLTADLITQKQGDLFVKVPPKASNTHITNQAAKAAAKIGTAVANAIIDDVLKYFEN